MQSVDLLFREQKATILIHKPVDVIGTANGKEWCNKFYVPLAVVDSYRYFLAGRPEWESLAIIQELCTSGPRDGP